MEHKGVIGGVSVIGIWFLMIAFGASLIYRNGQNVTPDRTNTIPVKRLAWDYTVE